MQPSARPFLPRLVAGSSLCVALISIAAATEIHRWTDENGVVHFGDRPPVNADAEIITIEPNVYSSPTIERLSLAIETSTDVVMYSTTWCGYCRKAREYFRANRIPFKEYDVEKSAKGKRDYKKLGAAGVPVILIGGARLNGFSEQSFRRLYDGNKSS